MQRRSPKLSVGCSRIPRSGELWGDRVVSVSLVTLALPLIRGFSLVFFARSPRHRLSVRMASNFRAHGNLFLCAQKDISVRTKISRLPHSALTPCLEDIIFLASQPNFRAGGRGFLWARKLVLEGFGGEAESFLEWKECVDEEDGLRLGAESAEGKVVGFGDKPCLQ